MKYDAIKAKLHDEIENGDERLLKIIYAVVKEYNDAAGNDTTDQRRNLILAERANYLAGDIQSYDWDTVKQMALNKSKRREL